MTTKALGAVVAAMAVLVGGLAAQAQGPIRIGASLSLTGTYAKLGRNQHEGYKLCEKDLNATGGLLGRKVEFVVYDDQSTPATAVRLYEKLITEDMVDGVMGPYSSPVTEASANVTEKYKKVMVAPLAATTSIFKRPPDKKRYYVFMVISPAEAYLEGLIDMAAKRGLKTVGNTDFAALLTKVKSLNPDVVAAATYFDDAVALTRQMRELDVSPKAYGVTVGGDLPEFYDTLKANAEYVYGATQWEHVLPYPGNHEFFGAYKKEFGHEPSYHSAAGYAGCLIYAEAVKRAGTLDADRVREQLLKLEMRTVFGDYKVDQDGFQVAHRMVTFQWQEGKKVVVWPDEMAPAKPRFPTPPWNQR